MFAVEQGRREGRRGPCEEGERAGEKGGALPRTEEENAMSRKKQGQEQGRKMRERILKLDAVSGMDFIAYCEILMKTRSSVFCFCFFNLFIYVETPPNNCGEIHGFELLQIQ